MMSRVLLAAAAIWGAAAASAWAAPPAPVISLADCRIYTSSQGIKVNLHELAFADACPEAVAGGDVSK